MFKRHKEKKVRELLLLHLADAELCLINANRTFSAYLAGDLQAADEAGTRVSEFERHADQLRREIYELLSEGAFLPIQRADIHAFVASVDDLAGMAEDLSDLILGEKPDLPDSLQDPFQSILDLTAGQFQHLKEICTEFFADGQKVHDNVRVALQDISRVEHDIDWLEWDATQTIFNSDLPLANKMHLKGFLVGATNLSNQIEDISDTLGELVIKLRA